MFVIVVAGVVCVPSARETAIKFYREGTRKRVTEGQPEIDESSRSRRKLQDNILQVRSVGRTLLELLLGST